MKKVIIGLMILSSQLVQAAEVAGTAAVMGITYVSGGLTGISFEKFSEGKDQLNKEILLAAKDDAALFLVEDGQGPQSVSLIQAMAELSQTQWGSSMNDQQKAQAILALCAE